VRHDLRELLARGRELVLALGERAPADASHSQPLQLADIASDLLEETLDVTLSLGRGHGESVSAPHETGMSRG
jgi:hypothetical protein